MIRAQWGEMAEQLRRSTVQVRAGRNGSGSGVVWPLEGTIVTNAHVLTGGDVSVELWDGRRYEARIAAVDPRRDLARLQITAPGLPAATLGDSDRLRAGELAVAVGNPLGFVGALSTGTVQGVGPLHGLGRRSWVRANVRLAPGNSGGPLADAQGRVIGINTMIAGGTALAIPVNEAARFVWQGGAPRLGVTLRPVQGGLLVLAVERDSPAALASLLQGDVLLGADGRKFRSTDDLAEVLEQAAGRTIRLEFLRGDRRAMRQVPVQLPAVRAAA